MRGARDRWPNGSGDLAAWLQWKAGGVQLKVYITGLEGDARDANGIGNARAIRQAYPHARLVGVSYAPQGQRIEWPDIDEWWDVGPWHAVNLTEHQRAITERLAKGASWISGRTEEAQWLAQVLEGHERVLAPPMAAIEAIRLPAMMLANNMGLSIPASISAANTDWDLNTFGRRHGWRVWLRASDGWGQLIPSWQALHQARIAIGGSAYSDAYFLQQHVEGTTESLAFAAYQGDLLVCVLCVEATNGVRSASRIDVAPSSLANALAEALRSLRWTGGGALSLIRDSTERRWVIGAQGSFPAWIYGAALAGHNLPARLIERATGETPTPQPRTSKAFARIMIEIPLHEAEDPQSRGAYAPPEDDATAQRETAPVLAPSVVPDAAVPQIPNEIVVDVTSAASRLDETPAWLFLPEATNRAFQRADELMRRSSTPTLRVRVAYSVKTNPDPRLLERARASGLLAETISQAEVKKALACGFPPGEIILNGPAKRWPAPASIQEPLHALYCDSLEELRAAVAAWADGEPGIYHADILGIRLRTPGFASRFGIPIDTCESRETIAALVRQLPETSRFGIHFHMASNAIGLGQWWRLFDQMLVSARDIETSSGRRVVCLDIGGGWFPDDWRDELSQRFGDRIIQHVTQALPHVRELCMEPGRALAQSSMALAVRVLEVRRESDGCIGDVVVDGSIAELAYHNYTIFPHRFLWHDPVEQRWRPVGRGTSRILGRLCMEKDILAEAVAMPESLAVGDLLVFCDAGAYDRSMSYSFGRG